VIGVRQLGHRVYYQVFLNGTERTIGEAELELEENNSQLSRLLRGESDPFIDYEIRLRALELQTAYGNHSYASLSNARLEPKPYQIFVAHRVVEQLFPRFILADEVGLGKTIEAGMIIKELRARAVATRILVVAPANLVTQWQWELENKFNERFVIYDSDTLGFLERQSQQQNPWLQNDRIICSLHFARTDERILAISDVPWDLVIFDEAHHLRQHLESGNKVRRTKAYHLAAALASRVEVLLFLTATPLQLHAHELFSLVHLLAPDRFPTFQDFERYLPIIPELNRCATDLAHVDDLTESERLELAGRLSKLGVLLAEQDTPTELFGPLGRAKLLQQVQDLHSLAHVMIRNRKRNLDGFVEREATTFSIALTPFEAEVYTEIQEYVRWAYQQAQVNKNAALGWTMQIFQKLLTSSSYALAASIRKRIEGIRSQTNQPVPDLDALAETDLDRLFEAVSHGSGLPYELDSMERFLSKVEQIGIDSKLSKLEELLDSIMAGDEQEKVLIFTQFTRTMEYIAKHLRDRYRVTTFHGGMSREEKDESVKRFKHEAQVMIATEAGGEGRNLQFCHFVINYDLPWNPMKVEQRIGRVDRVGQKKVFVYSLTVAGTVEERIYQVLNDRLHLFETAVGSLDPILGDLEKDFRRIILEHGADYHREVDRFERSIAERIAEARRAYEVLGDFIMDSRSFRRDGIDALLGRNHLASWRDLEQFIRAIVTRYASGRFQRQPNGFCRIEIPSSLREAVTTHRLEPQYGGTFDPDLAREDESVPFLAFGCGLVALASEEDGIFPGKVSAFQCCMPSIHAEKGLLFHYLIEFTGIRKYRELHSVALSWDGTL
jgi:SNF2 family DNA or RNA helicase